MSETTYTGRPGPKDFTRKRRTITFRIDDDVFEATPAVPAGVLVEFANSFTDVNAKAGPAESFGTVMAVLEMVLLPESFKRMAARADDLSNPVEIDQLSDVLLWLLEEYGLRPTQPSSNSSTGPLSPGSGTSLTASTPAAESTSLNFPSTGS